MCLMQRITADKKYQAVVFLVAVALHLSACFAEFAGHSALDNHLWSRHFSEALFSGTLYPRWLTELNAGCGSPVFFLYFPFPFYILSLFQFLPGEHTPVIAAFIMLHALSGVAFYRWAGTWSASRDALLVSVLYLLMPYAWVDMYTRNAYTEFYGFLFIPVLLNLTRRIIAGDTKAIFLFSAMYALQVMSSLHMTFIGSLLILFYSFHLFIRGKSFHRFPAMVIAVFLGTAISAIYLLPAAEAYPHVRFSAPNEALTGASLYRDHLVISQSSIDNRIFLTMLIAASFLVWSRKSSLFVRAFMRRNSDVFFWTYALLASLLLMTRLSSFIVDIFPFFGFLQFPWRFGVITGIAIPAITACLLDARKRYPRIVNSFEKTMYAHYFVLAVMAAVIVVTAPESQNGLHRNYDYNIEAFPNEYLPSTASHQWLWPDKEKDPDTSCASLKVWAPAGAINSLRVNAWRSRYLDFQMDLSEAATIVVGQFSFPYWQAQDEQQHPVAISTSPEGLMSLSLPRGEHHITIRMEEWESEYYGKIISLTALVITLLGYILISLKRRPKVGATSQP